MSENQTNGNRGLRDARVLIIGGSSGIGFSVAQQALSEGARVTIASSQQARVDNAIERLRAALPDLPTSAVSGFACDLSNPETLEANLTRLFDSAVAVYGGGPLDHIAFTAGDPLNLKPLAETSAQDLLAMGIVRFLGTLLVGKLAPRYLAEGPRASITLTGGVNSHRVSKGWTVPAAYGSGIEGTARGLAVDLAPRRVNCVMPGILKHYGDVSLVGTVGSPADLAEAYVFCMKCAFVTGSVLPVEGGVLVK